MKIAFLCSSISRAGGGIFEAEKCLAQDLARDPRFDVEIFGHTDPFTGTDYPSWSPLQPRHFPHIGPDLFRYSPGLRDAFLATPADLVHSHALWMYNSVLLTRWARHARRPYLISLHGLLDPWALRNSGWKKRLALLLYERRCLESAACLHATTAMEIGSVRELGLRQPICVIPNGVDLPDLGLPALATPKPHPRRTLLFLGRLHPKKGLPNLLEAWAAQKARGGETAEWTLEIAGWDQGGHEEKLQRLASQLGLTWSGPQKSGTEKTVDILFAGPQFGADRDAAYRRCDGFVLPSFSEGLPVAVLEAWSYAKPVLMTPGCNLPEGLTARAAWMMKPNVPDIARALADFFRTSEAERNAAGQRGRQLVEERFTWTKIGARMGGVYIWLLGKGPKPPEVVED
jgi:glycosyltransferase involved in cell wall biosynthesis